MLSENLQSLAEGLRRYVATGMTVESSAVVIICAILESAIEDAEELEARTVPALDRQTGDLPENVVRIATKRVGWPVTSGPGDAA